MKLLESIKSQRPFGKKRSHKFETYKKRIPYPNRPIGHIAFIGSETYGFRRQGKVDPNSYFSKFEYAAWKNSVSTFFHETPSKFLANIDVHKDVGLVLIMMFNEDKPDNFPSEEVMKRLQRRPKTLIYNHPAAAKIITDKRLANFALSNAGIDTPLILKDSSTKIFSNERTGHGKETIVINPGDKIDDGRHNTEYIDTKFEYEGKEYFSCLRAMCVGTELIDVYVRCRPVSEGSPNVHSKDTPLDADLINYIHCHFVTPNRTRIEKICQAVGNALGYNFCALDILLDSSGRLPICELNLKFDDYTIIDHLWPISSDLDFMQDSFSYKIAEKAAEHVINTAKEEGIFETRRSQASRREADAASAQI